MKKQKSKERMIIRISVYFIIMAMLLGIGMGIYFMRDYYDLKDDKYECPQVYMPRDLPKGMRISIQPDGNTYVYQDDKIIMEMRK